MTHLYRLLLVSATLFATACDSSSDDPAPTPNRFAAADKIVEDNLATIYAGNAVLLVSQDGQLIHEKSFGTFNPSTLRNVASATKLVSGAVLLALQDAGELSLNDKVSDYLPEFTGAKGNVTIRQLFAHTSGFPGNSPQGYENSPTLTLAQAVSAIAADVPLARVPGSGFEYGGVSMHIAGRVAEVATGKTWAQLFDQYIKTPCQMTSSVYNPNIPNNPQIAGGLTSSPRDYLNFLEMLAGNGVYKGTRVLSTAAVNSLFVDQRGTNNIVTTPYPANPHTPYGTLAPIPYSVGAWLDVYQGGNVLEISSPGAFGTHPWVDRERGVCGILFTFLPNGWTSSGTTTLQVRAAVRTALGS